MVSALSRTHLINTQPATEDVLSESIRSLDRRENATRSMHATLVQFAPSSFIAVVSEVDPLARRSAYWVKRGRNGIRRGGVKFLMR
jgi:hypothetical protein